MSAFGAPTALALAALVGLTLGLVGDGTLDLVGALLLAAPIASIALAWRRRTRPKP